MDWLGSSKKCQQPGVGRDTRPRAVCEDGVLLVKISIVSKPPTSAVAILLR